jgi:hypothetical protein
MIRFILLAAFLPWLASCGNRMHWTERASQDRIMLVAEHPPTLGYKRIAHQVESHPDLGSFLRRRGNPDFIAETSSDDRQYLILYYLTRKQAYACRTWRDQPDIIEFAGPYDITSKEVEILRSLKRGDVATTRSGIGQDEVITP